MKYRPDAEMVIRKIGKSLIGEASRLVDLLTESGADATRLLEPDDQFDYRLQPKACIKAEVADCLLAVMLVFDPGAFGTAAREIDSGGS